MNKDSVKKELNQLMHYSLDDIKSKYNKTRATGIRLNFYRKGLHLFRIDFDSYAAFFVAIDSPMCEGLLNLDVSCDITFICNFSVSI